MGIVVKQSVRNSIILFAGVGLGALNILILFPIFLSPEILGLTRVLVDVAVLGATLATLGMPSILVKFMPSYRDGTNFTPGLLNLVLKYSVVGFVLIASLFLLAKPYIMEMYGVKAPLFSEYFYLVPVLMAFIIFNQIFAELCKSLFRSVYQTFVNELLVRFFVTLLILAVAASLIGLHEFILGYAFTFAIGTLAYIIFLSRNGELVLSGFPDKEPGRIKKLTLYGAANFLTNLSGSLASRFDSVMIVSLAPVSLMGGDALEAAGIYAFGLYVATLIGIPGRGMMSIALPVVSKAWKENDHAELLNVYRKTALNQLIFGGFIFVIIWLNIDVMLSFVPDFDTSKWVILMVGISKLVNIAFGINTGILITSKYYYVATLSLVLLTILVFTGNFILIPTHGINGAAFSTMIAMCIVQVGTFIFTWVKFKMQPFTMANLLVLLMLGVGFGAAYIIPALENVILDVFVRTVVATSLFFLLILMSKVSPEINSMYSTLVGKLRSK